jgi:hypothetical protein
MAELERESGATQPAGGKTTVLPLDVLLKAAAADGSTVEGVTAKNAPMGVSKFKHVVSE